METSTLSIGFYALIAIVAALGLLAYALAVVPALKRRNTAKRLDLSAAPTHVQSKLLQTFGAPTFQDFLQTSTRTYHRTYKLTNRRDFEAERERTGRVATAVYTITCNGTQREAHIHMNEQGVPVGINLPRAT